MGDKLDYLLSNAHLATMTEGSAGYGLRRGALAVREGRIAEVLEQGATLPEDLPRRDREAEVVDGGEGPVALGEVRDGDHGRLSGMGRCRGGSIPIRFPPA